MTGEVRALATKVWTTSNASLATVQTAVNAFLAGQGTPALVDTNQLIGFDVRSDGTVFYAYVLYTE